MVTNNGKYIIVIPPRGKIRHGTLTVGDPERIGVTECGIRFSGWRVDGDTDNKEIRDCKRCLSKMETR